EVEEAQVARVDVTLEPLEPVALPERLLDDDPFARQQVRLDVRQRRWRLPRPHVRPDDAVALDTWIRPRSDLRLEAALRGLTRHIDARAFAVELPAVIHAAKPFLLVSSEEEGRAAMGAVVLNQPDSSGRHAEGDEVLAEQTDAHGRPIGLRELAR